MFSLDGELFLLHDETFEMTTNITEVFPDRAREPASNFMWDDIKQLGAGSWFLEVSAVAIMLDQAAFKKKQK